MNNNLTEAIIILDSSTSMRSLEESTINHFQEFIDSQKKLDGDINVTLATFDSRVDIHYDGVDINEVDIKGKYLVKGMTALYDAIGLTFNRVGTRLAKTSEDERPSKVIVVIITDGEENSSKEFMHGDVSRMIKEQKEKYKWEIIFIGANIDASVTAKGLNIDNSAQYSVNEVSNSSVYHSISKCVADYRNTGVLDGNWNEDIVEGD